MKYVVEMFIRIDVNEEDVDDKVDEIRQQIKCVEDVVDVFEYYEIEEDDKIREIF